MAKATKKSERPNAEHEYRDIHVHLLLTDRDAEKLRGLVRVYEEETGERRNYCGTVRWLIRRAAKEMGVKTS